MQPTPRTFHLPAPKIRGSRTIIGLAMFAIASASAQDYGSYTGDAAIAEPGTQVQLVTNKSTKRTSGILGYSEGPAVDAEGNLYFTEDQDGSGNIWKVGADGKTVNFYSGPSLPNGMEFDPQGRLIVCEKVGVSAFNGAGTRTPLAMNPALDGDKRINDVTIASTGAMFFTNWDGNNVFYRSPDGAVRKYTGYRISNGIEWAEENKILYLSQDGPDSVYRYEVNADGTLKNEKRFAAVNEPDGMTLDEKGNLYVASWMDGKIQVFDSTGKSLGSILIKSAGTDTDGPNGNASNCVFGGSDNKTLFITGDGGAYKIPLKIAGRKRPGSTHLRNRLGIRTSSPRAAADGYSINGKKFAGGKASGKTSEKANALLLLRAR
jgi:gluconolactonase